MLRIGAEIFQTLLNETREKKWTNNHLLPMKAR